MRFRKAVEADVDAMVNIINQGRSALRQAGIDQWQDGYPDRGVMASDVAEGNAYVLEEDTGIAATVTVSLAGESCYRDISGGSWLSHGDYAVVHRLAVADKYKGQGLSSRVLREIEALCISLGVFSIKADTHPDNQAMHAVFRKNGFTYCGVVIFQGSGKNAFEKVLAIPARAVS